MVPKGHIHLRDDYGFPGPIDVCQLLRTEYMSLLLGRTKLKVRLNMVNTLAEAFGATLQRYRLSYHVDCW